MKLWILRPVYPQKKDDDPWAPWYDKTFGFVVRAETEEQARAVANENAGDENMGEFMGNSIARTNTPWLDANYSTCVELTSDGEAGLIIEDHHSA